MALLRRREILDQLNLRLVERTRVRLGVASTRFAAAQSRLQLLSPMNVLQRGFSITMDGATGKVLRSSAEAQPGQKLRTRFAEGEITSRVEPASER